MRNLLVSPLAPEKNRQQAIKMKARLVQWMQQHEPHKVSDLEQRIPFRVVNSREQNHNLLL
jgi:hypothetical protein